MGSLWFIYYEPINEFPYLFTESHLCLELCGVGQTERKHAPCWFSSVQFSRSVMSDSLRLHEPQHARPPCPSPTPRVYPNSCPLSRWCHPTLLIRGTEFSRGKTSRRKAEITWKRRVCFSERTKEYIGYSLLVLFGTKEYKVILVVPCTPPEGTIWIGSNVNSFGSGTHWSCAVSNLGNWTWWSRDE